MEYKTEELWKLAEQYQQKAKTVYEKKNLQEAAHLVQDAVRLFKICGDDYQYVKCLNYLGVIYANMGDESIAVDYYLEGLQCAKEKKFYDIISLFYNNIGSRYQELEQHEKAIVYFKKALEACQTETLFRENSRWDNLFVYRLNLAISYQKLGEPKEAFWHLKEAECAMEQAELKDFALAFLVVKCSISWDNGDYEFVKQHLQELLSLGKNLSIVHDYVQNVQQLAALLKKTGEYEALKELLLLVEETANRQDTVYYHLISAELWMEYYDEVGREKEYKNLCVRYSRLCRQQKEVEYKERVQALDMRIALKEKEEACRLAERQAVTDSLTGVGNRYGLEQESRILVKESAGSNRRIGIGILDVDCFKQVNDTYGHNAGDEYLRRIAKILKHAVSDSGSVYRFGGDEFVILIPEGEYEAAQRIAERIKRKLEEARIENSNSTVAGMLTLSQGYACFRPYEGERLEGLLERADKALYKIKGQGKNGYRIMLEEL